MGGVSEGLREGGGAKDDVVLVRLASESCFIDSWKLGREGREEEKYEPQSQPSGVSKQYSKAK